ncbi:hypothetical protein FRC12_020865 [Ceratobasidium sp. 428]|nr:hypothetical protein FRC12_020865 [Ceratobasidium sp. 428]
MASLIEQNEGNLPVASSKPTASGKGVAALSLHASACINNTGPYGVATNGSWVSCCRAASIVWTQQTQTSSHVREYVSTQRDTERASPHRPSAGGTVASMSTPNQRVVEVKGTKRAAYGVRTVSADTVLRVDGQQTLAVVFV